MTELRRLTAVGRGAVAVIRFRSDDPVKLDEVFQSSTGLKATEAPIGRVIYGKWGAEDLVVVRVAEDAWEINCHGGDAALKRICDDLGGQQDSDSAASYGIQDRIFDQLLRCRSRRTAELMLSQANGVYQSFLHELLETTTTEAAGSRVLEFLKRERLASHLTSPWKVAIAGRPNAGKSSLLNALVGFERAIVFDQPGTTRDRVEAEMFLAGWPVTLVDTAGIRTATDQIESQGVELARSEVSSCDICLFVVDAISGWTPEDDEIRQSIPNTVPVAVVRNKIDLPSPGSMANSAGKHFDVSALTRQGLDELLQWIGTILVPDAPSLDEPLPVLAELNDVLRNWANAPSIQSLHDLLRRFDS